MRLADNIAKHPLESGVYLGYDSQGYAWKIKRSNSSYGSWSATSKHHPYRLLFAFRLSAGDRSMSEKLKGFSK